jgi:NADH:quinone reductase (non-electrogenic)
MPLQPHVVIVGGGFGGLYAAKALGRAPVRVTLLDRRNFHLFQPLLYQVATGGLSPGEIASPLRAILHRNANTEVLEVEVVDFDPANKKILLSDGEMDYDILLLATGVSHHYFGHEEWARFAPGLKTVEDALEMRQRILSSFEAAERETDDIKKTQWMSFVVVGGGPTGVELAGALAELAYSTLKDDFRHIDPRETKIYLLEGTDRLLPSYPEKLSHKAEAKLRRLGVIVRTQSLLTQLELDSVTVQREGHAEQIKTRNILWAAGVQASPLGKKLAERTGAKLDRSGRVLVEPDLTIAGHPEVFVIGDLALFTHQGAKPLPGVAPVAMQEGKYVAQVIRKKIAGKAVAPFHYHDKGNLAVIGRNAAVADLGHLRLNGFTAWLLWAFVHIRYLIEFDNKLLVLIQWAWNYFTRKRGARLITGKDG